MASDNLNKLNLHIIFGVPTDRQADRQTVKQITQRTRLNQLD